jgi:hypothetical protein
VRYARLPIPSSSLRGIRTALPVDCISPTKVDDTNGITISVRGSSIFAKQGMA